MTVGRARPRGRPRDQHGVREVAVTEEGTAGPVLRAALTAAMKQRDTAAVASIRPALAATDNA